VENAEALNGEAIAKTVATMEAENLIVNILFIVVLVLKLTAATDDRVGRTGDGWSVMV
jgi:hypothetical protein